MDASVLDLRYRMRDVLKALERREQVRLLYHGKVKGTIIPASEHTQKKIKDHPFFGMSKNNKLSVDEQMRELRKGRYDVI